MNLPDIVPGISVSLGVPHDTSWTRDTIPDFPFLRFQPIYEKVRDALAILGLAFDAMGAGGVDADGNHLGDGYEATMWALNRDGSTACGMWIILSDSYDGVLLHSSDPALHPKNFLNLVEMKRITVEELVQYIQSCDLKRMVAQSCAQS